MEARSSCKSSFVGTASVSAFWSSLSTSFRSSFALGTSLALALRLSSSARSSTWARVGTNLASTLPSTIIASSFSCASTLLEFAFLSMVVSSFLSWAIVAASLMLAFCCTEASSSRNLAMVGTSFTLALSSSCSAICSSLETSAELVTLSSFAVKSSSSVEGAFSETSASSSSSFCVVVCALSSTFRSNSASKSFTSVLVNDPSLTFAACVDTATDSSCSCARTESCTCWQSLTTGATCFPKYSAQMFLRMTTSRLPIASRNRLPHEQSQA
mmetsp:Transcript_64950/g.167150  ORF Transcript_64950/g.167150 Transcript_64950/m.167150 type:complete len:271 (-) Transcript_64950:18-830(-)